jgi:hypothetical protein
MESSGKDCLGDQDNDPIQKSQPSSGMWSHKGKKDSFIIIRHGETGKTYRVWMATDPSNRIVLPDAIAASGAGLTS